MEMLSVGGSCISKFHIALLCVWFKGGWYLVRHTQQQEVGLAGGTDTSKDTMKGRSMVLIRNYFHQETIRFNGIQWKSIVLGIV
jgi:hypothetical protein